MIKPYQDRVFVRDVPPGERKTGYLTTLGAIGLVAPETADKPDADRDIREVIVVAVGPGFLMPNGTVVPTGVKVGDRVLVTLNATDHKFAEVDGERLRIVRFWDLLGVIEDEADAAKAAE